LCTQLATSCKWGRHRVAPSPPGAAPPPLQVAIAAGSVAGGRLPLGAAGGGVVVVGLPFRGVQHLPGAAGGGALGRQGCSLQQPGSASESEGSEPETEGSEPEREGGESESEGSESRSETGSQTARAESQTARAVSQTARAVSQTARAVHKPASQSGAWSPRRSVRQSGVTWRRGLCCLCC
jgi:hypothetical protein